MTAQQEPAEPDRASTAAAPQPDGSAAAAPPPDRTEAAAADGSGVPILLQVRPRKITIWASIAATVVVGSMIVVSLLLLHSEEGVSFRVSDQIGLLGVGLVLGAGIMTAARPRLRADRDGLWVRNILGEEFMPWALVLRIGYPQGAPWAQLVMPDDEVKPVMAIQALDRSRAVAALDRVRQLQAEYGPPPPAPTTARPLRPEDDEARPLGRLEIIDRQKAAERDRDLAARQQGRGRKGGKAR